MLTNQFLVAAGLLVLLSRESSAFGRNFWTIRKNVELYQKTEAEKKLADKYNGLGYQAVQELYLTQPLDHFDPLVEDTYRQRYFVNTKHWSGPNGPVFLYIGGEGALSQLSASTGEHVDLAEKYGALVFAVEHRFYGESLNDNGLKLEHMQYLSSQQALADLSTFHHFASETYNLTSKNTWICFGGSYPGSLSAWFRVKYPHLVYGAISSSSPVRAELDFTGYNDVVAHSLSDPIVNGSLQCTSRVRQAFAKVDDLIKNNKLDQLSQDFKSCKPLKKQEDIYQFVSSLADLFMGVVQYNEEAPGNNISTVCEQITTGPDAYEALVQMNKKFLNETQEDCQDNSWESFLALVANTTVVRPMEGVGLRQWLYQTCTQFGYYQSCDKTECPFSSFMVLQPNLDICSQVFNMSADKIPDRISFTNAYYGSDQPRGTRIVFVNGSIDPWHALSVLKDLSATETAIYIPGTAHCANMHSNKPGDPIQLRLARKKIDQQIGRWLHDARQTTPHPTLYTNQL